MVEEDEVEVEPDVDDELSDELVEDAVAQRQLAGFTEIHMVNGENPHVGFDYYLDTIRLLREALPDVFLKCYTASEIHHMTRSCDMTHEEVLRALIDAGKAPGRPTMTQDEINACLVEHGRTGALVVRLKGGDPFVFGRGSEEAEALHAAGIDYEVVPGLSSAAGCSTPRSRPQISTPSHRSTQAPRRCCAPNSKPSAAPSRPTRTPGGGEFRGQVGL